MPIMYTKQQLDEIVRRHAEVNKMAEVLIRIILILAAIVITWLVIK